MLNHLIESLKGITEILNLQKIPYMIIGGLSNFYWGNPRFTQDIDITISCDDNKHDELISVLKSHSYMIRCDNPTEFIKETRVLPILSPVNLPIDLIFALLPYEEEAIKRAITVEIEDINVCFSTAEDLIIHKIISDRPRDKEDVRGIILRQGLKLDRIYLDPIISILAEQLENPDILTFYNTIWDEFMKA